MHQIDLIDNPFNYGVPAWRDSFGRIGIRVEEENSVKWYDCVTDSGRSYILDEMAMVIDTPFNDFTSKVIMEI